MSCIYNSLLTCLSMADTEGHMTENIGSLTVSKNDSMKSRNMEQNIMYISLVLSAFCE